MAKFLKPTNTAAVNYDQCWRSLHLVGGHRCRKATVLPIDADRKAKSIFMRERGKRLTRALDFMMFEDGMKTYDGNLIAGKGLSNPLRLRDAM